MADVRHASVPRKILGRRRRVPLWRHVSLTWRHSGPSWPTWTRWRTETLHTVSTLPTARRPGCPFDPPAELTDARRHGPINRYPFPDGHQGWLITGYDLVLGDPRFSSHKELMRHHPTVDFSGIEVPPAPPGEFLMDEPQHGRYRKPLVGRFTVRRMRQLTERVEQITAEHLDAMEQAGPPRDLVTAFATPIPAIMICELLGVPYADRGSVQEQVMSFLSGETSDEDLIAAYTARAVEELLRYLTVAQTFMRTTLEDVELGGQVIEAGTAVSCRTAPPTATPTASPIPTCSTSAGRRADTSPRSRHPTSAWASSWPASRCGSRSPHWSTASPTLLAVPADEVALRPEAADIVGVRSLPVTWGTSRWPT